jgi:hypothetical protein
VGFGKSRRHEKLEWVFEIREYEVIKIILSNKSVGHSLLI